MVALLVILGIVLMFFGYALLSVLVLAYDSDDCTVDSYIHPFRTRLYKIARIVGFLLICLTGLVLFCYGVSNIA